MDKTMQSKLPSQYVKRFEEGEYIYIVFYLRGNVKHGPFRKYRGDVLLYKANYFLGLKEGEENEYTPSGKLFRTVNYVNDSKDGEETILTTMDNLPIKIVKTYVRGIKQGLKRIYYNDIVISEVNYVNNRKDGFKLDRYFGGSIHSSINYIRGRREGFYESFYPDGAIKEKVLFINGDAEGEYSLYYNNGQPKSIFVLKNGYKTGPSKTWNIKGIVASESFYAKDIKVGYSRKYNFEGKLIRKVLYMEGRVCSDEHFTIC